LPKENQHKIYQWGAVILILLFSILILYLNFLMPYLPGDDFLYQLQFTEDGTLSNTRITHVADLFQSTINHYNTYNNRIFPHLCLQLVLLLPPWCFDILNSIAFLLLPYVLLGKTKLVALRQNVAALLSILLFLWIFHFDLGRSYFWTSGALNYTWPLLLQLYFIRRLFQWYNRPDIKIEWHFIPIALLIATTNENVVLTLTVLISFGILFQLIQHRQNSDLYLSICLLILLGGGLLMYFSPALESRLIHESASFDNTTQRVMEYLRRTAFYFLCYIPVLLILFFHSDIKKIKLTRGHWMLLAMTILLSLTMVVAPKYDARSAIAGFMVVLLLVAQLCDFQRHRPLLVFLLITVSAILFFNRIPAFKQLHIRAAHNTEILKNHNPAQDTVFLRPYCTSFRYSTCLVCDDISDVPEYIDKEPLAAFYNIPVIAIDTAYSHYRHYLSFVSALHNSELSDYIMTDYRHPLTANYGLISIGTKAEVAGQSYIFQVRGSNMPDDYIFIVRGAPKGFNAYRIIDLLPLNLRLFMLEYLEHHQVFINHNGVYYNYELILDNDRYAYYIGSLYSLNNMEAVGNPFVFYP
jgi:hypothetical protein